MPNTDANWLPGVHAAPAIQTDPTAYDLLNQATDPAGLLTSVMWSIAAWDRSIVLDLGTGTGFFAPMFAEKALHVFAVEPDDSLRLLAMQRVARDECRSVSVIAGSAERVFLPDESVDVAHARFAYFWGAGCEPGLRELARVIRPGGTAFIIDNDDTRGTFAGWTGRSSGYPQRDQAAVERFWRDQGFDQERVTVELRFASWEDFARVIANEFPDPLGAEILAEHAAPSLAFSYALLLYHRTY
ncbi:class I SAM-dependent methyltransferase [Candidatus Poribacteria bacterium]|jgi:ubiquinone/menaquinone biosynthesis C-methylase UbiE|nr:class I SAM-dependent methyltransferase [Candidatus Poribacteria bacterium]MBT5535218.1 class I SAM-dependent methyltransferase [Candidatus Poribacteria bacterium]MBT5713798.1 class I SAM-dependent methyltransferase [Candidatus Poribacteria bacterium]MBT7099849.1 class I SAM-dependent methyltransferase [Candidatus Poribacteria bacterium]MBT7808486.1 class I SAM-dependent methyltransferase [Candidatus Poribacteria bacterium]